MIQGLTSSSSSSSDTTYSAQETTDTVTDCGGDSSHASSDSRVFILPDRHCDDQATRM